MPHIEGSLDGAQKIEEEGCQKEVCCVHNIVVARMVIDLCKEHSLPHSNLCVPYHKKA